MCTVVGDGRCVALLTCDLQKLGKGTLCVHCLRFYDEEGASEQLRDLPRRTHVVCAGARFQAQLFDLGVVFIVSQIKVMGSLGLNWNSPVSFFFLLHLLLHFLRNYKFLHKCSYR